MLPRQEKGVARPKRRESGGSGCILLRRGVTSPRATQQLQVGCEDKKFYLCGNKLNWRAGAFGDSAAQPW